MERLKFILIVLVFILPFVFAKYLFDNDATTTRGTTNHGVFLSDEINIVDLKDNDHWIVLQVIDNECNLSCQDNMHMLRQINTALGKDMDRVERYLLINNTYKNVVDIDNYPKLVVLDSSESLYNKLTEMDERIFIADPFGKIILGYGNDFVAKGLLKDIKKLLKFSRR
tara:strand:+ start:17 stop:523 length:507 start_codon:yes stop_codon:yes gene_type:complete